MQKTSFIFLYLEDVDTLDEDDTDDDVDAELDVDALQRKQSSSENLLNKNSYSLKLKKILMGDICNSFVRHYHIV